MRSKRGAIGVAVTVALALVAIVASRAVAETSRTEYKEAVEPICKENSDANRRILAGVRTEVNRGKLRPAAAKFAEAAAALAKTYRELEAVPKPVPDSARLGRWLAYVKVEVELLQETSRALKAGEANRARTFVAKLTHNVNLANSQIATFDFHSCVFRASQYT